MAPLPLAARICKGNSNDQKSLMAPEFMILGSSNRPTAERRKYSLAHPAAFPEFWAQEKCTYEIEEFYSFFFGRLRLESEIGRRMHLRCKTFVAPKLSFP